MLFRSSAMVRALASPERIRELSPGLRRDLLELIILDHAMLPRVVSSLPATSLPAMVPSIDCELS